MFLVFEEDMEFWPKGRIPYRDDTATASADVSRQQFPPGHVSEFLVDFVKISTAAHRHGVGDFVWMGHQPHGPEPNQKPVHSPRIGQGSQFVMITQKGARSFLAFLNGKINSKGRHIDQMMKQWMIASPASEDPVGCCYIWPPMGNYAEHESECCPGSFEAGQVRKSLWDCDWACVGTAPYHDPFRRTKKLVVPPPKGQQQVRFEMDEEAFDGEDYFWRTFFTEDTWDTVAPPLTKRQKREKRRNMHQFYNFRNQVDNSAEVSGDTNIFMGARNGPTDTTPSNSTSRCFSLHICALSRVLLFNMLENTKHM